MGRNQPRHPDGTWRPSATLPARQQSISALRSLASRDPLCDEAARLGAEVAHQRLRAGGARLGPREFCRTVARVAEEALAEQHGEALHAPSGVPYGTGGSLPVGMLARADASWAALSVYEGASSR